MFRLGYVVGDCWCEHSHAPVYDMQPERITATVPDGDPIVLKKLSTCLRPPFLLLYILHTPRGEAEPGRYQSDAISPEQLFAFVERFGSFLRGDGRYELWLHSPADAATIAWDRHNLLFAYGPLADYEAALRSLGSRRAHLPFRRRIRITTARNSIQTRQSSFRRLTGSTARSSHKMSSERVTCCRRPYEQSAYPLARCCAASKFLAPAH